MKVLTEASLGVLKSFIEEICEICRTRVGERVSGVCLRKLLSPSRNEAPRGAVGDHWQQNRNEPKPECTVMGLPGDFWDGMKRLTSVEQGQTEADDRCKRLG